MILPWGGGVITGFYGIIECSSVDPLLFLRANCSIHNYHHVFGRSYGNCTL